MNLHRVGEGGLRGRQLEGEEDEVVVVEEEEERLFMVVRFVFRARKEQGTRATTWLRIHRPGHCLPIKSLSRARALSLFR